MMINVSSLRNLKNKKIKKNSRYSLHKNKNNQIILKQLLLKNKSLYKNNNTTIKKVQGNNKGEGNTNEGLNTN